MAELSKAESDRSFEHGAAEGRRVVELISVLCEGGAAGGPLERVPFADVRFGLTAGQRRQFWNRLPGYLPTPYHGERWMDGLISTLLPDTYVDAGVIKMDPFERPASAEGHHHDLLHYDYEAAPMCNGPWHGWGLTAFAHWDGECCGDAWFFDLRAGTLGAMPVGCGDHVSYEHQISCAYHTFRDPADWRRFLVDEARRRESLTDADADRLRAG